MRYHVLPYIGAVKFNWADYMSLPLAVILAIGALLNFSTSSLLSLVMSAAGVLCAVIIVGITLHLGRRRVEWEEFYPPHEYMETILNVALIEGSARWNTGSDEKDSKN